jgi:type IV secretion system protein VirD4
MSIYVGVNPDDLHRLRPVLNLFFQQAIGLQTRELPERNPALKHQVMMLLDEFTALGRIPIIAEAISYLPGYNVRVVLVIQTPAQLREVYGMHNSEVMLKSLAARIVFAPKDFSDAREISDELGFQTVAVKTVSKPVGGSFSRRGSRSGSQSVSQQRRALLLPQEVKELGGEEAIVFYEGLRPIRCRKIRYFADRRFRKRLLPAPEVPLPARAGPHSAAPPAPPAPAAPVPAAVEVASSQASGIAISPLIKEHAVIREGTVEDIDRLESLTLEDFATDFSKVEMPQHDGKMSDAEARRAVASFLHTIGRS